MIAPRLAAIHRSLGIPQDLPAVRGLPECREAEELVIAETGPDSRPHLLTPAAAAAWQALKAAAADDGIGLFIVSAFRSIDRQAEIVRRKLDQGADIESVLAVCAPPGFSEHHTGRAVDVACPGCPVLEAEFDQTAAFAWLQGHGGRFGFRLSYPAGNLQGYAYEPWHWCFRPEAPSAG